MSDKAFFGDRKQITFEKGKEKNGTSIESTVVIGGRLKAYGIKNKKCESYITPRLTSTLIERTRQYDEYYKKESKSKDYKGVVPYVGSNTEKMRANSNSIETPTRS